MSNNFCKNCGAALGAAASFCNKCGTAIAEKPAPVETANIVKPAPSQAMKAEYKFILPTSYKKSLVSIKGCSLIFSDTAIIAAMVDNKMMQAHIAAVKESVRGEKLLKRTAAVMKAGYTYSDKYRTMGINEIMAESQNNFLIRNNTVEQIKFRKGAVSYSYDDTTTNTPPTLIIKCPGSKYTFTMNTGFDSRTFIGVLRSLFPGQYKGPKK